MRCGLAPAGWLRDGFDLGKRRRSLERQNLQTKPSGGKLTCPKHVIFMSKCLELLTGERSMPGKSYEMWPWGSLLAARWVCPWKAKKEKFHTCGCPRRRPCLGQGRGRRILSSGPIPPLLPLPVCLVARFALHFCSSACQGWVLCFLPPPSPLSFPLFCRLLVVCSPCLFSAFVVSPVFPLLLVAGCPCSLPPFLPPPVCVCETQKYRSVAFGVFSTF